MSNNSEFKIGKLEPFLRRIDEQKRVLLGHSGQFYRNWSDKKKQFRSLKLGEGYGNTEEFGKLEIENYCMGGTGVILSQGLMKKESDSRKYELLIGALMSQ